MAGLLYRGPSNLPPVVLRVTPGPTRLTYVPKGLSTVHYATDRKIKHLLREVSSDFYVIFTWPVHAMLHEDFVLSLVKGGAQFYFWSYLSDMPESFWRDCGQLAEHLSIHNPESQLYIEELLPIDDAFTVGPENSLSDYGTHDPEPTI